MKSNWIAPYDSVDALSVLRNLALMHAKLAGPERVLLTNLVKTKDYLRLLKHEVNFHDVRHTPLSVYHAQQVLALYKKYEALPIDVDREAVAYVKFCESERVCRNTNQRLASLLGSLELSLNASSVIHSAMRKIECLLGEVPKLSDLDLRFGPGASTSCKATRSSPRWKLGARLECSNELLSSAHSALRFVMPWALHHCENGDDGWRYLTVHAVPGKLQFVPKSALTHRSIVVEPTLNGLYQLGIGTYLKKRLLRAGVNLHDQSRNQELARLAIYRGLATIDLSAASDSIAIATVRALLPPDWFDFLSRFRTGRVSYQGHEITLEKFSSMGNGFTFELETLIFWALAHGVADTLGYHTNDIAVYGDDIIVPTGCVDLLTEVFTVFGFSVNGSKSFRDPPFFESCGADWYLGFDVRPYFQKRLVSAETLFSLHNFYKRRFLEPFASYVRKRISPNLQIFGPDGYGDGHLLGHWAGKPCSRASGWEGFTFDTFSHRKLRLTSAAAGDSLLPAYSIYRAGGSEEVFRDYLVFEAGSLAKPRFLREVSDLKGPVDHFVVRGSNGYRRTSIYTLIRPT